MKVKLLSCVQLFAALWTVAHQAPPSMGFSRQEYWSGLPFPFPGDLPDPGIEPRSSALQADALPLEPSGKASISMSMFLSCCVGVVFTLFLTIMPDYGLRVKITMAEAHCIYSLLTNYFYIVFLKTKPIVKPDNWPKIILYPLRSEHSTSPCWKYVLAIILEKWFLGFSDSVTPYHPMTSMDTA